MKINKKLIGTIEWIITIALLLFCLNDMFLLTYGKFSPIKAHEASERTYHYGPSDIIKTINLDGGKIYLCRYKDWISANTVRKGSVKWYPSDQVSGPEIDFSKQVTYSWSESLIKGKKIVTKVYGYVNDEEISNINLEVEGTSGSKELEYELDENRMFIFYWIKDKEEYKFKYLRGLNNSGKVVYEKELHY